MTNQDNVLKSRDITLPTKVHLVKAMVFPVVMYACENWTIKKAECRKTETLESPLDCKEIQPVYPKGKQSWVFIGRTDAEDEAPVLWPPDVKSQLIGNDLDAGKDWRQEEKQMTEDKIFGWYHRLSGHEFEQALGDGEEQGSLECSSPWVARSWTQMSDWNQLHSCLENPMDRGAWSDIVHGITKSHTWLKGLSTQARL